MRLLFATGEASGDGYAAALLAEVRRFHPEVEVAASGGGKLQAAGVRLVADSRRWGAVSIVEALKVAPSVIRGLSALKRELRRGQPGVLVAVDFGAMNVRLCRAAKAAGWKILYFIPPGSWRRERQASDLVGLCDEIVTPFPWSAEIFRALGASVHYFGHPIRDRVRVHTQGGQREGIAVLPGSRDHEVQYNLPAILGALRTLGWQGPVRIPKASSIPREVLEARLAKVGTQGLDVRIENDAVGVLSTSVAGVVCSGSATLEAALCGCPIVVVYRGSKMVELEYKIRKPKFEFFALPNLILRRRVVAELLQHDASPERIAAELRPLVLEGSPEREAMLSSFAELQTQSGDGNVISQTAKLILELGGVPGPSKD